MTITGVNSSNAGVQGVSSASLTQTDEYSKGIQQQISEAQQELQELSANKELSMEEKMEKRQAIQQEITALQQQLRQHQIEQRRQQQEQSQTKQTQESSQSAQRQETSSQAGMQGLSGSVMAAMLSADNAMRQSEVQGRVATQMKGQANILESEIQQDKARGADTTKKEEDLADLQTRVQQTTASQVSTLSEAGAQVTDAAEQTDEENEDTAQEKDTENTAESETISELQAAENHQHVDIWL